jgi:DnaJ domain
MFVKTKERAGRTQFFLCIPEQGGNSGNSWKTVEYSVPLGETLDLSSTQWEEILRASPDFRSVPLENVLDVAEQYIAKHGLGSEILDGLREAVRDPGQKSRRGARSERRSQEDEYTKALRLLGLAPGSSNDQIESAFRKAARRHHPDVGGDPAKFRELVDARNLLSTRNWEPDTHSARRRRP